MVKRVYDRYLTAYRGSEEENAFVAAITTAIQTAEANRTALIREAVEASRLRHEVNERDRAYNNGITYALAAIDRVANGGQTK